MKDPRMIEHEAYLNDLKRSAAPTRLRPFRKTAPGSSAWGSRLITVAAIIVAVVVATPWTV